MTLAFTEQQGYQKICDMKDSSGLWHLCFPAMENYMKKTKKPPTSRRGWVLFILVSRLLHFLLRTERLPDKCIPN